ncbi:hypothetical protein [Saccharothrix syringae]|uniref:Uncharacterized protein n=1 Tax=Saccharothrix syringae TaxID=103733 RepID=A0A5Q0GXB6_SACSY|nr:hypothetical protein [Saccharothrix syringae]QFZ18315.1 hypothetical protein EKG83_13210 [Saccharothrix syringae]
MTTGRTTGRVRANLGAGPLGSYAFRVEATLGHRPTSYLFARSTGGGGGVGERAVTVLLVLAPAALAGTRVTVRESRGADLAEVTTFLPTMRVPKVVSAAHVFECLPLTDVGYVDLMSWLHPPAREVPAGPPGPWSAWHDRPGTTRVSEAAHGYRVVETVSAEHGIPVARSTVLDGEETRRWEAVALGSPEWDHLPTRIRVTRPRTGHWTVFERTTDPRPVPPEWVEADSATLRRAAASVLEG